MHILFSKKGFKLLLCAMVAAAMSGCTTADSSQTLVPVEAPERKVAAPKQPPRARPPRHAPRAYDADTPPQLSIEAPAEVVPGEEMPLSLSLHNRTDTLLRVESGTPCTVFVWKILEAATGQLVQRKPIQVCVQMVATDTLLPGGQLSQSYSLQLDAAQYAVGGRYELHYSYWRFSGIHEFVVTQP